MIQEITSTLTAIFKGADTHNWQLILDAMDTNILLDYSSLSGNPPATLPATQIVDAWKSFLPGFHRTHHQLSDFQILENGSSASAHFSGVADHFISTDVWTVQGTYDAELKQVNGHWRITLLRFNLQKQSGNTELPALV
jgi:hypothetical protein